MVKISYEFRTWDISFSCCSSSAAPFTQAKWVLYETETQKGISRLWAWIQISLKGWNLSTNHEDREKQLICSVSHWNIQIDTFIYSVQTELSKQTDRFVATHGPWRSETGCLQPTECHNALWKHMLERQYCTLLELLSVRSWKVQLE